jgi:hypothetical protein
MQFPCGNASFHGLFTMEIKNPRKNKFFHVEIILFTGNSHYPLEIATFHMETLAWVSSCPLSSGVSFSAGRTLAPARDSRCFISRPIMGCEHDIHATLGSTCFLGDFPRVR